MRDAAQRQERIQVIVYLNEQPAFEISRQEKAARSLVLRGIANQLEQLTLPFALNDVVPAPVRFQVRSLGEQREVILEEMRANIYSRAQASVQGQQQRFRQFVEVQLNGRITAQIILANCFGIEISAEMLARLEQHPDVSQIGLDHTLELDLQGSTLAVGADTWWNNGFTGPGWYDAAVLDTGVTFNPGNANGLNNQQGQFPDDFNNYTGPDPFALDNDGHGTSIAGIIAGEGTIINNPSQSQNKGVAYGIGKIINGKVADIGNTNAQASNLRQAIEWAIFNSDAKAEGINISMRTNSDISGYSDMAQFIDFYIDYTFQDLGVRF